MYIIIVDNTFVILAMFTNVKLTTMHAIHAVDKLKRHEKYPYSNAWELRIKCTVCVCTIYQHTVMQNKICN